MIHLPTWIKPGTADAYNYAYTFLYIAQPKDIRILLDKAKDTEFTCREIREFNAEVRQVAEYEPTPEELVKWKMDENHKGLKAPEKKAEEKKSPPETQNPS